MGAIALAFLSGILSTLSPCVLPLLPVVLGAALTQHRFAPLALAAGVALSVVTIGLFVATLGFAVGLDQDLFREIAAELLIIIGAVLLTPRLQAQLAVTAGPVGNWVHTRAGVFAARTVGSVRARLAA
jgi:cytochrome c-type biogenesis protein